MADRIRPISTRTHYKEWNALNVLDKVEVYIRILEAKQKRITWRRVGLRMWDVCTDLSIFDWWVDELSLSRLKEMRTFLREAIKLGFNGYVCFKVGATGCANGMWAHKLESANGYSPDDCDFLYKSFTPAYNYWDITFADGDVRTGDDRLSYRVGKKYDALKTIRDLEQAVKAYKEVA